MGQFPVEEVGLSPERLGGELAMVGAQLAAAGVTAVMEIVVKVGRDGRTAAGFTPLQVLLHNFPALQALGCRLAHWHLVLMEPLPAAQLPAFEAGFYPQMAQAVRATKPLGLKFGLEHNNGDYQFLAAPQRIAAALDAVAGLGFVCDLNHILPADMEPFAALFPRCSMLHLSDTPLPEVNYHLPIGAGNLPFAALGRQLQESGFNGVGILEIRGAPWSGGYGQDTDDALRESRDRLQQLFPS